MKITLEEVRRIAHLAHLRFGDQEMEQLRGELDHILGYIEKLGELDTDGIDPASGGATGPLPALRDDTLRPTLPPDEALANAPESGRGHFKVPKVIP